MKWLETVVLPIEGGRRRRSKSAAHRPERRERTNVEGDQVERMEEDFDRGFDDQDPP